MTTPSLEQDERLRSAFAGFDLGGWKQKDGKILPVYGGPPMDCWPPEITCFDLTFALEQIITGEVDAVKGTWENAQYA